MTTDVVACDVAKIAETVLDIELAGLMGLRSRFHTPAFAEACQLLQRPGAGRPGRVIVMGMGKSGHIGRKIAATFASTGTPTFYVHPAEAGHGDLGMVTPDDIVLALSYSGETPELLDILPCLQYQRVPIIALCGRPTSTLARFATVLLDVSIPQEACPLGLAPTTSTTAMLVMGDALAIVLLQARDFSAEDFARYHPKGALGHKLLTRVADLMHTGNTLPLVLPTCTLMNTILEISQKRLGLALITEPDGTLAGIFTDGDLRRTVEKGYDLYTTPIEQVMTRHCTTIRPDTLAADALTIMELKKITALAVVDEQKRAVGILHMHTLLQIGLSPCNA
ncbi:MAG: D-arabinose 5-phosphate isomerase [Gammaproteobacteria bacterium RIFCSPHIGHO2_12_FULL_45_9]|nr:MAG: D-arabinose 5-phosphate isomerase [Gammaproteobacteria bacterium RIFCSPHIGHO2_12_FULL_45_9]